MPPHRKTIPLLLILVILSACNSTGIPPTPTITAHNSSDIPKLDFSTFSDGGGEPRSPGYWLLWNSCAPDNNAEIAKVNGGREAGWIILDDLLQDPGILLGDMAVQSCPQSLAILNQTNTQGENKSSDALYQLASQLLAAEFNLAVGAETCPAVREVVLAGHLYLRSYQYDGQGDYLGLGNPTKEREDIIATAQKLAEYNTGALCK